ncbi:hypothetical protein VTK73DRAFT_4157 [Phialemonium thermophilum]|uniref:Uncharacterized protein n=1 Tax=Phialemonium thermophilum TaxID=223376 RepID=A0ABR3Y0T2_9PEZI
MSSANDNGVFAPSQNDEPANAHNVPVQEAQPNQALTAGTEVRGSSRFKKNAVYGLGTASLIVVLALMAAILASAVNLQKNVDVLKDEAKNGHLSGYNMRALVPTYDGEINVVAATSSYETSAISVSATGTNTCLSSSETSDEPTGGAFTSTSTTTVIVTAGGSTETTSAMAASGSAAGVTTITAGSDITSTIMLTLTSTVTCSNGVTSVVDTEASSFGGISTSSFQDSNPSVSLPSPAIGGTDTSVSEVTSTIVVTETTTTSGTTGNSTITAETSVPSFSIMTSTLPVSQNGTGPRLSSSSGGVAPTPTFPPVSGGSKANVKGGRPGNGSSVGSCVMMLVAIAIGFCYL